MLGPTKTSGKYCGVSFNLTTCIVLSYLSVYLFLSFFFLLLLLLLSSLTSRGLEGERDREVADLKDQLHRERKLCNEQQTAAIESQRKYQKVQEAEMINQDKLRETADLLDHLKKSMEGEKRRWNEEMDGVRRQHARDMEAQRKDLETRLETERKTVNTKDDALTKIRQELSTAESTLRSTVKELEAEKQSFKIQKQAAKDEADRKAELQKMFEKETGLKQDRVEEAHKLSRKLQNTLADKEKEISELRSDLAHRQKLLEETGKSLKTAEELAASQTDRADSMAAEYREVAELFGAGQLLSTTFLATKHIREKLEDHSKTKHDLEKVKAEKKTGESKLASVKIDLEGVSRERDDLKSIVKSKDENLTRVREDLLNATRELRGLMIANEHVLQDKLRSDETIKANEKAAKKLNEAIEDLESAKKDTMRIESDAVRKWEAERDELEQQLVDLQASLEAKNECEVEHMARKIGGLEKENREQNEWVDMCKEIAKLFGLDKEFKTGDPQMVNKIYRKVEGTVEDAAAMKADYGELEAERQRIEKLRRSLPAGGMGMGTNGPLLALNQGPSSSSFAGLGGVGGGVGSSGGGGGGGGGGKTDYLKQELRRSTEAMAQSKRRFDDFKEAVAKALKFAGRARKVDQTTILARITNLVGRAVAPLDARFDDLLAHPCKAHKSSSKSGYRSSSQKPCQTDPKTVKQLERVQKKLRSALETIEAQDMWISVMQAKLGNGEEDTGLKSENHELRAQLDSVRGMLLSSTGVQEAELGFGLGAGFSSTGTSLGLGHRSSRRKHPVL